MPEPPEAWYLDAGAGQEAPGGASLSFECPNPDCRLRASLSAQQKVEACRQTGGVLTLARVIDGLRGQPSLPASGNVLRSTVQQHASATRIESPASPTSTPPTPA